MPPTPDAHIVALNAETIGRLDSGRFGAAINRAIRLIAADINDRPANAAGKTERRKLKIEIAFEPVCEYDQETREKTLVAIHVEPRVFGTCPPTVGSVHQMKFKNAAPHFNVDAPHSFDSRPLFDLDDEPAELGD